MPDVSRHVLLLKHATPVLEGFVPAREWVLGHDGQDQAARLAKQVNAFMSARVVTSSEVKAIQTGQIIAKELGALLEQRRGLDEIERPPMPILPSDEYEQIVRRVFNQRREAVIGKESADCAERRFSQTLDELVADKESDNLIVVSHGMVISLFVRRHNDVDALRVWKSLACASGLLLDASTYSIVDIITPSDLTNEDGA